MAWRSRLTDRSSVQWWETYCRTHSSSPGPVRPSRYGSAPAPSACSSRSRTNAADSLLETSSARSSSEAPIEPAWALASPSADGALKQTMAGSTRATCLTRDASSASICRGSRFPCSFKVVHFGQVWLQQQHLHAMCVDHVLARRPREDREPTVLGCNERDRVPLILDELRGGEVTRAAKLGRVHDGRFRSFDRLGHHHLFD